ncbi:uncharacterized protein ISCGN_020214 [Ixodes scapularis]
MCRLVRRGAVLWVLLVVLLVVVPSCHAAEADHCYSAGGVAGIVVATAVVTAVLIGLGLAAAWYLLRRQGKALRLDSPGSAVVGTRPQSATGSGGGDGGKYAYDNPYFRDEESSIDVVDKGRPPSALASTDQSSSTLPKSNGATKVSRTSWAGKAVPFSGVFANGKKHRTMDDSCLPMEPERILVPLRGHDFTGLGFNICGNMRDGIFVKDVLNRGPANESGLIKPGDRIASVTVSFANMVYEDALTILSYASPYDVKLELVKPNEKSNHGFPSITGSGKLSLASRTSGKSQRLFHPLYRSQSIDDLTQIGKENGAAIGPSSQPKRSQSIGVTTQLLKTKNLDSIASDGYDTSPKNQRAASSTTGSLNEKVFTSATCQDNLQTKAAVDPAVNLLDQVPPVGSVETLTSIVVTTKRAEDVKGEEVTPTASGSKTPDVATRSPKKIVTTPAKRKAPAPPVPNGNSIKTTAQVHHSHDREPGSKDRGSTSSSSSSSSDDDKPPPLPEQMPGTLVEPTEKVDAQDTEDTSLASDAPVFLAAILDLKEDPANTQFETTSIDSLETGKDDESPTRRKASSLGDLTAIDEANKSSPTLLERAVSLDFPGSVLPEENLSHQKILMKKAKDYGGFKDTNGTGHEKGPLLEEGSSCSDSDEDKAKARVEVSSEDTSQGMTAHCLKDLSSTPSTVKSESYIELVPSTERQVDQNEPSRTLFVRETVVLEMKPKHSVTSGEGTITTITPSFEFSKRVLSPDFTVDIDSNNGESLTPVLKSHSRNSSSSSLSSDEGKHTSRVTRVVTSTPAHRVVTVESFVIPAQTSPSETNRNGKEVIEISKNELDKVMLSHKDFLLKKAHETGMYAGLSKEDFDDDSREIEFESWHYTDADDKEPVNGTNGSGKTEGLSTTASFSQYKTAIEGDSTLPAEEVLVPQKVVDKSGFHMKTVEGPLTTTVIISTTDGSGEPTVHVHPSETTDSPPPELFSPL